MQKALFVLFSLFVATKIFAYETDPQQELFKAAVSAHNNEIKMCYRDNLKKMKGGEGKVVIEFEVNDQGVLTKSAINEKKTTLKNEFLFECMQAKIKTWVFPAAPKGKALSVSYPYIFKKN